MKLIDMTRIRYRNRQTKKDIKTHHSAFPIWVHLPSHNGSKDLPSGQRKQRKNCQRTDYVRRTAVISDREK